LSGTEYRTFIEIGEEEKRNKMKERVELQLKGLAAAQIKEKLGGLIYKNGAR
jgi:hypothetical protein